MRNPLDTHIETRFVVAKRDVCVMVCHSHNNTTTAIRKKHGGNFEHDDYIAIKSLDSIRRADHRHMTRSLVRIVAEFRNENTVEVW